MGKIFNPVNLKKRGAFYRNTKSTLLKAILDFEKVEGDAEGKTKPKKIINKSASAKPSKGNY